MLLYPVDWNYFWLQYSLARPPRRSVLVVEDDDLLKPTLAHSLYAVDPEINLRWVRSLPEAYQALDEDLPDLILCDCLLGPEGTGLDLWRHCRENTPDVGFLMITGLGPRSLEKLAVTGGRETPLPRVLHKPFLPSECRREIQQLFDLRA